MLAHEETEGYNICPRSGIKCVGELGFESRSNFKSHTHFSRNSSSLSFHVALKVEGVHDSSQFLRKSMIGSICFLEVQFPFLEQKEAGLVWKLREEGASLLPCRVKTDGEVMVQCQGDRDTGLNTTLHFSGLRIL